MKEQEEEEDFRFREETADKKKLTEQEEEEKSLRFFSLADPSRVIFAGSVVSTTGREKQALNYIEQEWEA